MKKLILSLTLLLAVLFTSCATVTIPNSAEAKEKMEALGYTVDLTVKYGESAEYLGVKQMTILVAKRDEEFLQVYFFTNEEDTMYFYRENAKSLAKDMDVAKRNRYSFYRGTNQAVEDFLSE